MRRPSIDKTLLSTPNKRTPFYLGNVNANESVSRQNIIADGVSSSVRDDRQLSAEKNVRSLTENDAISDKSTVQNGIRDDGSDLLSNHNVFGSMVSINENFNMDADAMTKNIE